MFAKPQPEKIIKAALIKPHKVVKQFASRDVTRLNKAQVLSKDLFMLITFNCLRFAGSVKYRDCKLSIKINCMTKNPYQKPSQQTQDEAMKIAKGTQRPAQTKEQTKLIAQGIQKGIDLYKKQQKEKARDLSRRLKKASRQQKQSVESDDDEISEKILYRQHWLPWLLLVLTWVGIGVYFLAGV